MAYQRNQTEFYKLARRKKKEIIKLRMVDDLNVYSEKELDAINYFEGKGFYARYQHFRFNTIVLNLKCFSIIYYYVFLRISIN